MHLPGKNGLAPGIEGGGLDEDVDEVEGVDGALVDVDGCEGAHGLGKGAVFVVPWGAAGGGGAELPAINTCMEN